MSTGVPAKVRDTVLARAAGRCERCGRHVQSLELHHRKFRSRGGHHTVENVVALCGWGNHTGCHGWAHTIRAEESLGFALHSWETPLDAPIVFADRGAVHLLPFAPWIVEFAA